MLLQSRYELRDDFNDAQESGSSLEVLRTSDNLVFLASDFSNVYEEHPNGERTQLAGAILPSVSESMSQILNHYNIISLVDLIHHSLEEPFTENAGPLKDFSVWENMNAGSLDQLLPPLNRLPGPNDQENWIRLGRSAPTFQPLPEGLCWHVLRSVSRALLWLHYGLKKTHENNDHYETLDQDWQPILIRDVSPSRIWFQHPIRDETYGTCKLGGFVLAKVVNSIDGSEPITTRPTNAGWEKELFWAPEVRRDLDPSETKAYFEEVPRHDGDSSKLPYWTPSSEVWSLGATVYMMMTGTPPPRYCSYEMQMSRIDQKIFSQEIRSIIGNLLSEDPQKRLKGINLVGKIDPRWAVWRAFTKEGNKYVDIWDDEIDD